MRGEQKSCRTARFCSEVAHKTKQNTIYSIYNKYSTLTIGVTKDPLTRHEVVINLRRRIKVEYRSTRIQIMQRDVICLIRRH